MPANTSEVVARISVCFGMTSLLWHSHTYMHAAGCDQRRNSCSQFCYAVLRTFQQRKRSYTYIEGCENKKIPFSCAVRRMQSTRYTYMYAERMNSSRDNSFSTIDSSRNVSIQTHALRAKMSVDGLVLTRQCVFGLFILFIVCGVP